MKANELRIGNYVIDEDDRTDSNIYIISRIETEEYTDWNSGDNYNFAVSILNSKDCYYDINPLGIPLTEEWLTNLGAEKYKKFIIHDRFVLQWKNGHNYWYVTDANFQSYITKIEFVHEWQNLFFTLTQKELTL